MAAAELLAAGLRASQAPTSSTLVRSGHGLSMPLPILANQILDNPNIVKSLFGYLLLLRAVEDGDGAKAAWLLEMGVRPDARPESSEAMVAVPNIGRVPVKNVAGDLTWAIDEGALQKKRPCFSLLH